MDKTTMPSWIQAAHYEPIDESVATHLVVGTGEIESGKFGGGILAYCDSEWMARRCAREILKFPNSTAWVVANSLETRMAVEMAILEELAEKNQENTIKQRPKRKTRAYSGVRTAVRARQTTM